MRKLGRAMGAAALLAASLVLLLAAPADAASRSSAEEAQVCGATFDGVDVRAYATPRTAKVVREDATIVVAAESSQWATTAKSFAYSIKLEFAGFRWTVASGAATSKSWQTTVDVAKYATRGTGIYKVLAFTEDSMGAPCYGRAYVKVEGDGGPVGTDAAKAALAVAALGAAGGIAAGVGATKEVNDLVIGSSVTDFLESGASDATEHVPDEAEAERLHEELHEENPIETSLVRMCWPLVALAVVATAKAVVSDAGRQLLGMIKGVGR